MASTEQAIRDEPADIELNAKLHNGSALMALAGVGFIGYGVVFLVLNFVGGASNSA